MATRVENTDGGIKAQVASFIWDKSLALTLDDWAYSTTLSISEAKNLVGALNEQLHRLHVVSSEPTDLIEFVD